MGLFSSKKKTHVSSQTYNMAGNYKERMNFAKTNVIGSVLRGEHDKRGMGEVIVGNYLAGPGIALRNINGWLERNNYWGATSQTKTVLESTGKINNDVVSRNVPLHGGNFAYIEDVVIGFPTTEDIVYSYMLDKYPEFYKYLHLTDEEIEIELGFSYEPSDDSNTLPSNTILVNYQGTSFSIKVPSDNDEYHAIISYSPYKIIDADIKIEVSDFEPMHGWRLESDTTTTEEYIRTTVIQYDEYDDGSIIETPISISPIKFTVTKGIKVWGKYSVTGAIQATETHTYEEYVKTEKEIEEIPIEEPDPEIPEEVMEDEGDSEKEPILIRSYKETITNTKIDPQKYIIVTRINGAEDSLGNRIYIYKYGSGNAELDSLIKPDIMSKDAFYPIIPFRYYKNNVNADYFGGIYKLNKQLYKRLSSGQNYDEFSKQVSSSDGIWDINTGFIQLGISLSTKEPESKEYLYTFFRQILLNDGVKINAKSWVDETIEWSDWSRDYATSLANSYNIPYTRPPSKPPGPPKPKQRVRKSISSFGPEYAISFLYSLGKISVIEGVYKDLKKGDIVTESAKSRGFSYNGYEPREFCISASHSTKCRWGIAPVGSYTPYGSDNTPPDFVDIYRIIKQVDHNRHEIIDVYQAQHSNVIKDGKSVTTYPFSSNDGGEESGCIVPLNPALIRNMSIKDVTQLSLSCKHITFTAWKITKQKWYKSGIFKIVMVVVTIVISIYFPPAGAFSGGAGILGANAALGATLGLAGTAAIVAGAAVNAIASMVVASVLSSVSSGIFGDKIGAIVGAVSAFVVAGQISGASNGLSMAETFNGMLKADNIMSLTSSVGKGYMGYKQASTLDVLKRTQDMLVDMQKQIDDVNVKMQDEFSRQVILDPLFLSDAFSDFVEGESRDEFLARTLMVGSDVVEFTHGMINNFTSINLDLKNIGV